MNEDTDALDLATAEYYNLLIQGGPDVDEVSTEELVRFLAHACNPDEEEAILEALLESALLRNELIQIQTRLQVEAWSVIKEDSELKRPFLAALRDGFDALAGTLADRPVPAFVWQSVGREWRQILGAPRFSAVRGAESLAKIQGTEKQVRIAADVIQGDLQITLYPDGAAVGAPVWLSIQDPGGADLPLWHGDLPSEPIPLKFSQLGSQLGFDDGPAPASVFSLSIQNSRLDKNGAIDLFLTDGQVQKLPLSEPIAVQNGILSIAVDTSNLQLSQPVTVQFVIEMGSIKLILGTTTLPGGEKSFRFEVEAMPVESLQIAGTSLIKMMQI